MSLDAIQPIAPMLTAGAESTERPTTDFAAVLGEGIQRVDESILRAEESLQTMATGGDVATHDVMIAMEKARMSLEFAVEIRNRVAEAYQEIMRMQI